MNKERTILYLFSINAIIYIASGFYTPFLSAYYAQKGIDAEKIGILLSWAVLERVWQEDDVITVTCPFSLEFKPVDEKNKDIAALMFGPVVLAADKMTLFDGDMEKPEEWITCVDEKEMLFRTLPGHVCPYPQEVRTFRPYYKIPVMEWYFMYVRFRMQTEERR